MKKILLTVVLLFAFAFPVRAEGFMSAFEESQDSACGSFSPASEGRKITDMRRWLILVKIDKRLQAC